MSDNPYKRLAQRLDALPNGYPSTENSAEISLLEYLFTPQEANLTAQLRLTLESPEQIANRIGFDEQEVQELLREIARKGLIQTGKINGEKGYGVMPFVIGFYENQNYRMDEKFASLVEDYLKQVSPDLMGVEPQIHRVVPVGETVRVDIEVRPYESVAEIVAKAKAWAVWDCICRKQKSLIGDPCEHPKDNCIVFSERAGVFDKSQIFTSLTEAEALTTLKAAADAGLVHSVSNSQEGIGYICNCCTCSCGILRGMAEMGVANAVAKSAFVNRVEKDLCNGCEVCLEYCQFDALTIEDSIAHLSEISCIGCGVCVPFCDTEALGLVRRTEDEVILPPVTEEDWRVARASARGVDIKEVM